MEWVDWSRKDECELLRIRMPGPGEARALLEVNASCMQSLARCSESTVPNHAVCFIGDTGGGKSYVVAQLLAGDWPARGKPVKTDATEGIRVYAHRPGRGYRALLLDTEGLHATEPRHAFFTEEDMGAHNSYRRPGVLTLIPHFAHQAADVVVYVWGPETAGEHAMEKAYQACVECFSLKNEAGGGGGGAGENRPALLVLLNKQPLRRCFSARGAAAGGEAELIGPEEASRELRSIDERGGHGGILPRHFSSVWCHRLPFIGSKWRARSGGEYLTGEAVFQSAVHALDEVIHTALLHRKRSCATVDGRRVFLSELGWVISVPDRARCVNDPSFHRWAAPRGTAVAQVVFWNGVAFLLRMEEGGRAGISLAQHDGRQAIARARRKDRKAHLNGG
ncbi:hypothetical protein DIPPA_00456 [Diplonema papillatum]|nr:hypothetical protein DIPPA_00456 [Diplonema papillatum]